MSSFNSLLLFSAAAAAVASILLLSSTPSSSFSAAIPLRFPNTWQSFHNLSGSRLGDRNPAIALLKAYLCRFGYLSASNFSDVFDDTLRSTILTYQHNFGLDRTGLLDLPTIDQLIAPRCGVPDIINGTSSMAYAGTQGRKLYSYFPGEPSWPPSRRALTYAFTSTSAVDIDPAALRAVFARAFARWSAATTLSFAEADEASSADITIGFYSGVHGDGEPFDGVLGTLAHAFSPADGRFHLDAAEQWVVAGDVAASSSEVAVDLESVAVHEIGHLLGLGHSSVAEAIMYPTIMTRTRKVDLTRDDVEAIQGLYGRNPDYRGSSPTGERNRTRWTHVSGTSDGGFRLAGSGWERTVGRLLPVVSIALLVV